MSFQKVLTITLQAQNSTKMGEYIDDFIRGCQGDPTGMTSTQKDAFLIDYHFAVLKNTMKNQNDKKKKDAVDLEEIDLIKV